MQIIELSLLLRSQAYDHTFRASLNNTGDDLGVASDNFAKVFQKDRPLPASLREDIGCNTCSDNVPTLTRVDSFSSKKLPRYFSDNEIYVHCPKRAELVAEYLRQEGVKDGISDHSSLLEGQVKKTRDAFNVVQCLGCSGNHPVTVTYSETNSLGGVEVKHDNENPFAVKRTPLSGDLLWGITNYVGRIEHQYDYADQLEIEDREAATAYLATKRLINHLLNGHNKYTTYGDLDTPITLTLQKILSTIDGYDILNNRPNMNYSTYFIAREVVNMFIDQCGSKQKMELKDDYKYALMVKQELGKLI